MGRNLSGQTKLAVFLVNARDPPGCQLSHMRVNSKTSIPENLLNPKLYIMEPLMANYIAENFERDMSHSHLSCLNFRKGFV